MKPAWHATGLREKALFEWDKEMRRRGLAKNTMTLEQFFVEGIRPPKEKPE